ncbi:uncharacterized protein O3C94_018725 [Discoglossus pictus]
MAANEFGANFQKNRQERESQRPKNHIHLKDEINRFSLTQGELAAHNNGYNRVLLQVFGFLGHGKSSFINSCNYVLKDGEYKMHAQAAVTYGGLTMGRISYPLTPSITLVDNRGFSTMNKYEMGEIYAQLANVLPLDKPVTWQQGYEDFVYRLEESEMDPNFTDFIVPMLIYSVRKGISEEELPEMKQILLDCRRLTGIFPIIVLTHKTSENYFEVESRFKRIGAEVIYAVENYTKEDHERTRGRHTDILSVIYDALEDVKFHLEMPRNKRWERIERKKFLLKYAHQCYLKTGR